MNKTDDYFQAYGLGKDPFPVDTFDNVLFLTPELTHRIDRIKFLINETGKLVLVASLNGAGKSTLADYVESIAEKNWTVCLVQAAIGMDRETLSHEIIQQVSPDKSDEKSLAIPQLHKFLELCSRLERVPVLIIDDADKLPVETLEFILELSALQHLETGFRFVLFAGENINDRLNHESLVELVNQLVSRVNLPAFSRNQVKEYLDTRLSSSGEISEYPFIETDIDHIYRVSAGLPGGINILARERMQSRLNPGGKALSPRTRLLAVAAIIALAIIVVLFYGPGPSAPTQRIQAPLPAQARQEGMPASTPDTVDPGATDGAVTATNTPPIADNRMRGIDTADGASVDSGKLAVDPLTMDDTDGGTVSDINMADMAPEEPGDDIQQQDIANTVADTPVTVTDKDAGNISTTTSPAGPPIAMANSKATAGTSPAQRSSSMPGPSSNSNDNNIYQLDDIPGAIAGIRGEQWYREQDGAAYTLQLISASELDNVLELIEDLPGIQQDLSGYVKYTPSGHPRYLLFYGIYPDHGAAMAAISDIPARLAAVKPYARRIGSIIDEIETLGYWPR